MVRAFTVASGSLHCVCVCVCVCVASNVDESETLFLFLGPASAQGQQFPFLKIDLSHFLRKKELCGILVNQICCFNLK